MAPTRNNLLVYYANITTIADVNDIEATVGICSKYDAMVIKPHTSTPLESLKKVIHSLKKIKPSFKVFGWTDLANAADYNAWQTAAALWRTDLPTGYLDGIFIDNFSYAGTSTRVNQNLAVTYCHTNLLAVYVKGSNLIDILGQLTSESEPLIGRSTTIRDFVLVDDFFYVNSDNASPSIETKEHMHGRLEFVKGARKKTSSTEHNLGVGVAIGGGNATGISQESYEAAVILAGNYQMEYLSVVPFDRGATGHKYFYKHRSNNFND